MPSSKGRVLIVDDEPPVAAMLEAVVTALGYTPRVAWTGSDALRILPEFRPDVVLLDIALPDVRGEIMLDTLRATDPRLPVVMVTGNPDATLASSTLTRGAFDYVGKPFKLERLGQVLEAALAYRA
jgi:two-component system OmpR family response regulator